MKLHHFPSNSNLTASVPWLVHSGLSLSCQSCLFPSLFWSYHFLVMTKLWLDLRMCSAFICLFNIAPPPPTPTPLKPPPRPPKHTQYNSHLPRLSHPLLKSRVAVWFPWKQRVCMCVFSKCFSLAEIKLDLRRHTQTQVQFLICK